MIPTKIYKISTEGAFENHKWEYELLFPPHLANWDVWDYWEKERFYSMRKHLTKESILLEIGAEQGATTALIAKNITDKIFLIEPSNDFWGTIKGIFRENKIKKPIGFFTGFADIVSRNNPDRKFYKLWPPVSKRLVLDKGLPYKYLHNEQDSNIPSISIDDLVESTQIKFDAINIDIEGAEYLALLGAENTIKKDRPLIWVSIHPDLMEKDYNTKPDSIFRYMKNLCYKWEFLAKDHEEHYFFSPIEYDTN